jgi:hypothetical protein
MIRPWTVGLFHPHRRRSSLADYRVPMAHADWFFWFAMAFGTLVLTLTAIGLWLAGQP